MSRVLLALVAVLALAAPRGEAVVAHDVIERMPPSMKAAFYSLVEEYAPAEGSGKPMLGKEKSDVITELLKTVEKKIMDEKQAIVDKFDAKKVSLTTELKNKLNADNAVLSHVETIKAGTEQKVKDAQAAVDAAVTQFKKSEKAIAAAKEMERNAKLDNERVRVAQEGAKGAKGGREERRAGL